MKWRERLARVGPCGGSQRLVFPYPSLVEQHVGAPLPALADQLAGRLHDHVVIVGEPAVCLVLGATVCVTVTDVVAYRERRVLC